MDNNQPTTPINPQPTNPTNPVPIQTLPDQQPQTKPITEQLPQQANTQLNQLPPQEEVYSQLPNDNLQNPKISTPQQRNNSNKKSVVIVAILVLLVALLGIGAYAFYLQIDTSNPLTKMLKTSTTTSLPTSTQSSDIDTKKWSNFGDQNARYHISYPETWKYDSSTRSMQSDDIMLNQGNDSVEKGARLSVQYNQKDSLPRSTFTAIPSEDLSILSQKYVTVGQEKATYYVVKDLETNKKLNIVTFSDEYTSFEIKYEYEQSREQELTEIFDLILQSFQFTYEDYLPEDQSSGRVEPVTKDNFAIEQADDSIQATVIPGYVVENQYGGYFIIMQLTATSKEGNITELAVWADEDTEKTWQPYLDDFTPDSYGMSANLTTKEKGNVYVQFRDSAGNSTIVTLSKEELDLLLQE
ncbi:MAG: hypothetical protein COY81_01350 [Candidatus Pacebacteria bacterium CG_4_10_14_0_8_um_filter_43_12]|nr:MAG: hypothetical protein COY81_01350 [Candidatus Pacebacteria bacterium CG_4_10_14_0_8_um_filter_43_12]